MLLHLDAHWNGADHPSARSGTASDVKLMLESFFRARLFRPHDAVVSADTTYVVASHSGVGKLKGGMRRLDPQKKMRRLVYIHDLIPIEYSEYQRPKAFRLFTDYLNELTDAPITVIANSKDTEQRVKAYAAQSGWRLVGTEVIIPQLQFQKAISTPVRDSVAAFQKVDTPYFVMLSTIEPRKNHLLLLHIWRELAQNPNPPRLCIIGKRGWENENVVDMLERCSIIRDSVAEFSGLNDFEVQTLLGGARALLFPSFIEGLGIPVLEAAALGVPCILSDIPVFREIAPPDSVFLSPLDGLGWKDEIVARVAHDSAGRRRSHS